MIIEISKEVAEHHRRIAFENAQKYQLEIQRHCNQFPGYLEDKEYIQLLETKMDYSIQLVSAIDQSLARPSVFMEERTTG